MRRHAKYFTRKEAMELVKIAYTAGIMQGRDDFKDIYWRGDCIKEEVAFKRWVDKFRPMGETPL